MQRIQRKRTKGYKTPENTVYVGRPTKWGNPFTVQEYGIDKAVMLFKECILTPHMVFTHFEEIKSSIEYDRFILMNNNIDTLKGKNLSCFCSLTHKCHADVLLELANNPIEVDHL